MTLQLQSEMVVEDRSAGGMALTWVVIGLIFLVLILLFLLVKQLKSRSTEGTVMDETDKSKSAYETLRALQSREFENKRIRPNALNRAAKVATFVEVFGWVLIVLGALTGFVTMFTNSTDANGETTSNFVTGFIYLAGSLLNGSFVVMISAYIRGRSEQ